VCLEGYAKFKFKALIKLEPPVNVGLLKYVQMSITTVLNVPLKDEGLLAFKCLVETREAIVYEFRLILT
jgi:hypothetical protein